MDIQQDFDFALLPLWRAPGPYLPTTTPSGAQARDEGMMRALDHAERLDDEWPDRAYGFLCRYARAHEYFTIEEMTAEADRLGYGSPADGRAWGGVVRRAAACHDSLAIIQNTHTTRPRLKGHGAPGPVWYSLVFVGSAA